MDETSVVPGASVRVDLSGRSVLVTGAASGIGRACAERFARAGALVTVLDLNGEGARKVADEIGGRPSRRTSPTTRCSTDWRSRPTSL